MKNRNIDELVRGRPYGDNAQEIYLRCCDAFGWGKNQAECFTHGHRLYSPEDCDFNGNSVWFICYSNRSQPKLWQTNTCRTLLIITATALPNHWLIIKITMPKVQVILTVLCLLNIGIIGIIFVEYLNWLIMSSYIVSTN